MQAVPECSVEDCQAYASWNCGENVGKLCNQHYNNLSIDIRQRC